VGRPHHLDEREQAAGDREAGECPDETNGPTHARGI